MVYKKQCPKCTWTKFARTMAPISCHVNKHWRKRGPILNICAPAPIRTMSLFQSRWKASKITAHRPKLSTDHIVAFATSIVNARMLWVVQFTVSVVIHKRKIDAIANIIQAVQKMNMKFQIGYWKMKKCINSSGVLWGLYVEWWH